MSELALLLHATEESDDEQQEEHPNTRIPVDSASKTIRIHFSKHTESISIQENTSVEEISRIICTVFRLGYQSSFALSSKRTSTIISSLNNLKNNEDYDLLLPDTNAMEDQASPSESGNYSMDIPSKKRKRRKASEIDRSYKCAVANCHKFYGSENALKMHIKLKHPEYNGDLPKSFVREKISAPSFTPQSGTPLYGQPIKTTSPYQSVARISNPTISQPSLPSPLTTNVQTSYLSTSAPPSPTRLSSSPQSNLRNIGIMQSRSMPSLGQLNFSSPAPFTHLSSQPTSPRATSPSLSNSASLGVMDVNQNDVLSPSLVGNSASPPGSISYLTSSALNNRMIDPNMRTLPLPFQSVNFSNQARFDHAYMSNTMFSPFNSNFNNYAAPMLRAQD